MSALFGATYGHHTTALIRTGLRPGETQALMAHQTDSRLEPDQQHGTLQFDGCLLPLRTRILTAWLPGSQPRLQAQTANQRFLTLSRRGEGNAQGWCDGSGHTPSVALLEFLNE